MKPNTNFELSIKDIDIIEAALNAKVSRRAMNVALDPDSVYASEYQNEINELRDLLGRIYHQKNWYKEKIKFQGGG